MENEDAFIIYGLCIAPVPVLIYQQDYHVYNKGAIHMDIHQNYQ